MVQAQAESFLGFDPSDYGKVLDVVASVAKARPHEVTDFGDDSTPWLGKGICQILLRSFRVSMVSGTFQTTRDTFKDPDSGDTHDRFVVTAEFVTPDGVSIPASGSCSTDQKFIRGKRKDGTRFKSYSDVLDDAQAFAATRCLRDALDALCMLSAITWDDLVSRGVDRTKTQRADFGGGGGGGGGGSQQRGGRTGGDPDKDYLWSAFKGEVASITKPDFERISKDVCGGFAKINDMTPEQRAEIARRLRAHQTGPAGGQGGPLSTAPAGGPPAQAPAGPTLPAGPPPAADDVPATDAQKAELRRLCDKLQINSLGIPKLLTKAQGGRPWENGMPVTKAVAERAIAALVELDANGGDGLPW